jgi:hypothetical protein
MVTRPHRSADLYVGTSPCQDFSSAGDNQGQVWFTHTDRLARSLVNYWLASLACRIFGTTWISLVWAGFPKSSTSIPVSESQLEQTLAMQTIVLCFVALRPFSWRTFSVWRESTGRTWTLLWMSSELLDTCLSYSWCK